MSAMDIDELESPSLTFKGSKKDMQHRKKVMRQAQAWKSREPKWKRQLSSLKSAASRRK